jgi:hypothetical protein
MLENPFNLHGNKLMRELNTVLGINSFAVK